MSADPAGWSLKAQIDCVEREIGMRRSVYKRRVDERKMSQHRADAEINCMLAVLETLKRLAATRQPGEEG